MGSFFAGLSSSVEIVTDNGMTSFTEVDSKLVGPSGLWLQAPIGYSLGIGPDNDNPFALSGLRSSRSHSEFGHPADQRQRDDYSMHRFSFWDDRDKSRK